MSVLWNAAPRARLGRMRIALFHGYELTGSGSNEYTRYLARALAHAGHEVHVLCREPKPEAIGDVREAFAWTAQGLGTRLLRRDGDGPGYTLHQLPESDVRPVYVTDKQRTGNVKAFIDMTDDELARYRDASVGAVTAALRAHPVDVLHANHVVLQPTIAAEACDALGIPFIIYPHGSAIEYTVRRQERFRALTGQAIDRAAGLIIGSREVQGRLFELFPAARDRIRDRTEIVGVGVDTALFEPVARAHRALEIAALVERRPGGGKTPAQTAELCRRLSAGEIDAAMAYKDAYVHDLPDGDAAEHLARIPWESGKIMLFVGALTVGKGLQSVIAGLPALLRRVPDAHLVIIGSGAYREVLEGLVHAISSGDDRLLETLTARGNDLEDTHLSGPWQDVTDALSDPEHRAALRETGPRLAEHVHFVGRFGHDLLHHLFPCADVAVFPSVIPEAYPLVLMESLSNGVLPAATSFSGFAEGLDQLVPKLGADLVDRMRLPLEPVGRVQGIAERLAGLLQTVSEGLHDRLREIAVSEYDWAIRAKAMVAAYQRFGTGAKGS